MAAEEGRVAPQEDASSGAACCGHASARSQRCRVPAGACDAWPRVAAPRRSALRLTTPRASNTAKVAPPWCTGLAQGDAAFRRNGGSTAGDVAVHDAQFRTTHQAYNSSASSAPSSPCGLQGLRSTRSVSHSIQSMTVISTLHVQVGRMDGSITRSVSQCLSSPRQRARRPTLGAVGETTVFSPIDIRW